MEHLTLPSVGAGQASKNGGAVPATLACEPKDASLWVASGDVWAWEPRSGPKILFLDILIQKSWLKTFGLQNFH
jgi:hypothetical protein